MRIEAEARAFAVSNVKNRGIIIAIQVINHTIKYYGTAVVRVGCIQVFSHMCIDHALLQKKYQTKYDSLQIYCENNVFLKDDVFYWHLFSGLKRLCVVN